MINYFLPRHVHFCRHGDSFVFLDLRRDEYLLIDGDSASALQALLLGQPTCVTDQEAPDILAELRHGGLITTDASAGKRLAPTKVELALQLLVDSESLADARVTPRDIWHFIVACITAALQLRWRRIENIIARVEGRKRLATSVPLDVERARVVTGIFKRLRSFFPRNYLCLYDSLALLEFLSKYQVFPIWVFAVRLEPWAAHCWVQQECFVFDEDVEQAAYYTPVMTI